MTTRERTPGAISGTPLDEAATGLDLCVHCGFCLQACPTYLVLEDENDSPRGRLLLMRAAVEGDLELDDPTFRRHIDQCLGCRACETACPSGVPYGHLLEATRATFVAGRSPGRLADLLLVTMANETLRRVVLGAARMLRTLRLTRLLARLPGRAGVAMAMLESTRPAVPAGPPPAPGERRGSAALLKGCVMEELFAHTNRATERMLQRAGYELSDVPHQGCCGALHAHAGAAARARSLARANIAAFERSGADVVVVNAAGCGAMMKDYAHLLHEDADWADRAARFSARVRDVREVLAPVRPLPAARLRARVAYDAPCHLIHAQGIRDAPVEMLRAVPGLEVTPLPDADRCCGGAGIYNLVQRRPAAAILAPKVEQVRTARGDFVATGNPGCHMQIGAGLVRGGVTARCVHPVDLMDSAHRADGA
jgi:glycolate oxidase iron-sulfur subunit